MELRHALSALALSFLAVACGGGVESDPFNSLNGVPPAVNTRFVLKIDGSEQRLLPPDGYLESAAAAYLRVSAPQDLGDSDVSSYASVTLKRSRETGEFERGTFDCTPGKDGGAAFDAPSFFGFSATITDCSVIITYVSGTRVVGTASALAHAPAGSNVPSKHAEADFDVPVHGPSSD